MLIAKAFNRSLLIYKILENLLCHRWSVISRVNVVNSIDLARPKAKKKTQRDLAERKKAEVELRESAEKYQYLVKHAPTGIYEIDYSGP